MRDCRGREEKRREERRKTDMMRDDGIIGMKK